MIGEATFLVSFDTAHLSHHFLAELHAHFALHASNNGIIHGVLSFNDRLGGFVDGDDFGGRLRLEQGDGNLALMHTPGDALSEVEMGVADGEDVLNGDLKGGFGGGAVS